MVISGVLVILVLGALFLAYSTFWVKYEHLDLGDPDKKSFTVVQISDLHGQTQFINGSLSKMVNNVKPDLVMITGDLVSSKPQLDTVLDEIRKIDCPYQFFVPGNHERYGLVRSRMQMYSKQEYSDILSSVQASNMIVLSNCEYPIEMGEKKWLIYGFDNSISGYEHLTTSVTEIQKYDYVIMLAHSPSIIKSELHHQLPYDLLLVGHTHGGQVRLLGHTIGAFKNYHVGLRRLDKRRHFYINRGLGTSRLPIRLACSPEITVFTIRI